MKKLITSAFLCFLALLGNTAVHAQQQFRWAKGGGSTQDLSSRGTSSYEKTQTLCTDRNGNIYALNKVGTDVITADTFHMAGTFYSQTGVLITSYNCSGQMRWAKLIDGPDGAEGFSMTVDTTGHVYIAGWFPNVHPSGTKRLRIGYDTTFTGAASYISTGVLQLDTNGNYKWIRLLGTNITKSAQAGFPQDPIVLDAVNNVHFFCSMVSGITITPSITSIRGIYDLTYDPYGTLLSAVRLDIDSQWFFNNAIIDPVTNKVYATGEINPSVFGSSTDTFYAACFGADRSKKWQYFCGKGADDGLGSVVMDASKHLYFAGGASYTSIGSSTFSFNTVSVSSAYNYMSIIMKTDTNGKVNWINHYDCPTAGTALLSLALMPGNKLASAGYYGSVVHNGTVDSTTKSIGYDAYFVIVDTGGTTKLMQAIPGDGYDDMGWTIACDKVGNLYVGGQVEDTIPALSIPSYHTIGGNTDFFIVKYGYDCSCTSLPVSAYTLTGKHTYAATYTGTTTGLDSVVWDFGDASATVKGTTATHTYTTHGSYKICATAYTSCGTDVHCQSVSYVQDEVQQVNAGSSITVYPNPAGSELNITGVTGKTDYRLLSVTGSLLQHGQLHAGSNTISVGNLASGIYMLEMTGSNGERNVVRVVKE